MPDTPPHGLPRFNAAHALRLVGDLWGLDGDVEELASYVDQNFLLTTAAGDRFVLKLANSDEKAGTLELQNAAMARLADGEAELAARVVPALSGRSIEEAQATDGGRHLVRLLTYLPGAPLAEVKPRTAALHEDIGRLIGTLSGALEGFTHPAAERRTAWDPRRGSEVIRNRLADVAQAAPPERSPKRVALLECFLDLFERELSPLADELRTSVIHNDANEYNVLISPPRLVDGRYQRRVAGLIDFGEVVHSWTVTELAVGLAYSILGYTDPLAVAIPIVRGYRQRFALREAEIAALLPLTCMRLCLSVANSARERLRQPDNEYVAISERNAWESLAILRELEASPVHYALRGACGLEPYPTAPRVRRWLREHHEEIAPVIGPELREETLHVFDLGMGSSVLGAGAPGTFDAATQTRAIFDTLVESGAEVGYGHYDEVRCWYGGDLFAAPSDEAPRRRTVHIGVDLFLPAGASVFAPLPGTVHSLRDNAGPMDYGPTVVLEHSLEDADGGAPLRLYTLYGQLSRASLDGLAPGQALAAGERFAELGDETVNGGWAPHLHLQLVLDLLGREGDFSGVVSPAERETWLSLCPDPNLLLGLPEAWLERDGLDGEGILDSRRRHLGPSLSLAYDEPLHIARGFRQFLYDADGQPYLDAVNNVPHVGHSHPRVVAAADRQNAVLNTNTRYLHQNITRYAERLTATLPEPLEVCYFVCSGSEANELALRLARAHTGRRGVVTVDGAYHGNTSALVDISPYKHDGPGGSGAPDWVRTVPMPDAYRARLAADDPATARTLAAPVASACESDGGAAAFICEPLLGCGGQIVPPDGYLATAFAHARTAGTVCIADEVQIGFGRVGTHFWAFDAQGATPDVVTLGKPIGNGYPLAAVVTTREIAESFANGMEYFNTFGGNPVACAVGLAVLDVIDEEGLQENARRVGAHLLAGLQELAGRHRHVGDVRGVGLYLGVELVRDPETLEPAAAEAAYVVNRMKDHGILLGIDGPLHNVLKIKPPLVFDETDADRLVATLDRVLGEDLLRPGSAA